MTQNLADRLDPPPALGRAYLELTGSESIVLDDAEAPENEVGGATPPSQLS